MDSRLFEKVLKLLGDKTEYLTMRVESFSMFPLLKPGDSIIVKRSPIFKNGDVVVFRRKDFFIVHRVKFKLGPILLTRGDNSKKFDSPVFVDKIIGKVVAVLKKGNA